MFIRPQNRSVRSKIILAAVLVLACFTEAPAHPQSLASPAAQSNLKKAKDAYKQGNQAERSKDWDGAYAAYADAVNWAPNDREYFLHREIAKSHLVQTRMDLAERDAVSGRLEDARKELLAASYLDPTNTVITERLSELAAAGPVQAPKIQEDFEPANEIHLGNEPVKRSFDFRGDTQGVYTEVARQFGVEVAFDVDLVSRAVRFQISDVDFPTAMQLLGNMTQTFWRPLTKVLFFVSQDTPQKRRDYEPSVVRTVVLPSSETPEQMTETLRVVRDIAGITRSDLDTSSRTLTFRASPRAVAIASDLVDTLEKPLGELILEIEILQVDRNYARQLGITPPQTSSIYSLNSQQIQEAQQSITGLINVITQVFGQPSSLSGLSSSQISSLFTAGQIGLGTLFPPVLAFGGGKSTFLATNPGAAANFSMMLSLVQHGQRILLRAEDGQPATFFVGERFPVSLGQYSASVSGTTTNIPGVSASNFPVTNYATGTGPTFVATGSLRNNSISDLIAANFSDNTVSVLLGNGDGTFADQVTYPTGMGPAWIAVGDFNGDMNLDLAVANQNANTVSILLGNGDGTFKPKVDIPTGSEPVSVVAANFNDLSNTANLGLAVANRGDNTISIFIGNGDGTFNQPTVIPLPTGYAPSALAAADLNGDGHIDLIVADEGNNSISVFLGNGDGTFQARTDYATGTSPVWVSTGDFNGDGIPDLAVANKASDTVSILLGNASDTNTAIGNGTFVAQTAFAAGNGPTSIAVADYNIDGRPDLAVADQTDNAISLLLGQGGGSFGPNLELPVGTSPVAIVSADFNGDGKPDVADANNGSNNLSVILDSSTFTGSTSGIPSTPLPGVQYLDIGMKVKATPRIHQDNDVTLQLSFELSSLAGQSINSVPIITNQTVDQTVRVKENETAALAGILEPQIIRSINGTPGLSAIPGIGWLGQNQNVQDTDTELLILVTPRMVRLAPRAGHAIYAGQGSLDNAAPGPAGVPPIGPGVPPAQGQVPPVPGQPLQGQPQAPGAAPEQQQPPVQPQPGQPQQPAQPQEQPQQPAQPQQPGNPQDQTQQPAQPQQPAAPQEQPGQPAQIPQPLPPPQPGP